MSQSFAQKLYEQAAAQQADAGDAAPSGDDDVVDAEIIEDEDGDK